MGKFETLARKPLREKNVAVVGAGRSGRGAALLCAALGASVLLLEKNAHTLQAEFLQQARHAGVVIIGGEHEAKHFANVDLVVMSPGIPVAEIRPLLPSGVEVVGELELASRCVCKPILAITGTSGKTTTTSLAAAMLEHVGRKVFLGGNIGAPLSEYILSEEQADILVLEVSSFQLQTCTTFKPWVGALLNFTPNHLDYHTDMQEYLLAKMQLFARQDEDDNAILPLAQKQELEPYLKGAARVIWYRPKNRFFSEHLPGAHNQANMEAAYQATRVFGVTENEAQRAIAGFRPPKHRLSRVSEQQGVLYVNDSKATTVDSLRAALSSFERPILLLAGGKFKGGDLASLRPLLEKRVKAVGLYGGARERFEEAWNGVAPMHWEEDMAKALSWLRDRAKSGDVVLLSPATASFDQFANFEQRGLYFEELVRGASGERKHESAAEASSQRESLDMGARS